jgi:hypothetical protein
VSASLSRCGIWQSADRPIASQKLFCQMFRTCLSAGQYSPSLSLVLFTSHTHTDTDAHTLSLSFFLFLFLSPSHSLSLSLSLSLSFASLFFSSEIRYCSDSLR